jgi:hypothetical protein
VTKERTRLEWAEMAHKFHVATDGTCYVKHHPLCPFCNPHILEGDPSWAETSAPTATEPEPTTTETRVPTAEDQAGKVKACPLPGGLVPLWDRPSPPREPKGPERDAWAWEAHLTVSPDSGPRLVSARLWTGKCDAESIPIPQLSKSQEYR